MWASWLAVPVSSPLLLPPPLALRQLRGLLLRLRVIRLHSLCTRRPLRKDQDSWGTNRGLGILIRTAPHCIATLARGPWVLPHLIQLLLLNWTLSKPKLKLSSVTDFPSSAEKFREVGESQL